MSELRTSDAGLRLIKAYEGFRPDSRQLPDGRWVIGFGHTKAAREGLTITEAEAEAIAGGDRITSPMPGKVIDIRVKPGDEVEKDQVLAVMEAMKMEHSLKSPRDGIVKMVGAETGEQVAESIGFAPTLKGPGEAFLVSDYHRLVFDQVFDPRQLKASPCRAIAYIEAP